MIGSTKLNITIGSLRVKDSAISLVLSQPAVKNRVDFIPETSINEENIALTYTFV